MKEPSLSPPHRSGSEIETEHVTRPEQPAGEDLPTITYPKAKRQHIHIKLTQDEEAVMIEFLREHPEIYDNKMNSFSDPAAKVKPKYG